MKRPSKKDIQAAIEKLKDKPSGHSTYNEPIVGKPSADKKTSQRIRKQGV